MTVMDFGDWDWGARDSGLVCRYGPCTSGVLCSGGGNKHLRTGISDGKGENEGLLGLFFCSFLFLVSV